MTDTSSDYQNGMKMDKNTLIILLLPLNNAYGGTTNQKLITFFFPLNSRTSFVNGGTPTTHKRVILFPTYLPPQF